MHQIIAILAAAIAFLAGGATVRLMDAAGPIGMAQPAHTATADHSGFALRPMDAIPPFPSTH